MSAFQNPGYPIAIPQEPPQPPGDLALLFQVKVAYATHLASVPASQRPIPPPTPEGYSRRDDLTLYFRWRPSAPLFQAQITPIQPPTWQFRYGRAASIYIQGDGEGQPGTTEEYRVLGTYSDVTTEGVDASVGVWRELQFDHIGYYQNDDANKLRTPYSNVHNLSYLCLGGVHQSLAAPGSPDWMPELLPTKYNYTPQAGSLEPLPRSGGICGKLALILALIVLSCPRNWSHPILTQRVMWGRYTPHNDRTARTAEDRRVITVTVFLDPECRFISAQDNHQRTYVRELERLEQGLYGPIFR